MYGGDGPRLPYVQQHSVEFTGARSAGCWTLPATASMFTGLLPHEHGADTQTRGLLPSIPTLAERLSAQGYRCHQVTANVATTDVFGLDRGFHEVVRIWKEVEPKHRKLHQAMLIVGKPRLRRQVLSTDWVRGKLLEDIEAGKVWLQDTVADVFDRARRILAENERKGHRTFLFLNLMETHFPYHVADILQPTQAGLAGAQELYALYHVVNQTFMRTGKQPFGPKQMASVKSRQRIAWERIAGQVDDFARELHDGAENLVVVGSDHGECFGEDEWVYHFANTADGGTRVPLFWLDPGRSAPTRVSNAVSARDLHDSILGQTGADVRQNLVDRPEESDCILESCWYNCQGATLPRFKYNQMAFHHENMRYLRRNGDWYSAAPSTLQGEPLFIRMAPSIDPVEEVDDRVLRSRLRRHITDFEAFSSRIS